MTIRRLKTYTGSQGFVYQYYFVGQRPAAFASGTEYIFDVSSDRKTTFPISITLAGDVIAAWNSAHGRALTGAEQFAAVKMRLFRAFDEAAEPRRELKLRLDPKDLEQSLAALGVE